MAVTENAGAPPKLEDCEALEAFLRTEPREVSVIVAARAALRALPLFSLYRPEPTPPRDVQRFANTAASLFRALALAHAAGKWPRRVKELPTAHAAAAAGAAYAAAYASYSAAAADAADAAAACAAYAAVRAVEAADAFASFAGPQGYTAAAADAADAATAAAVAYVSFATAATSSAALTAARAGLWAAVLADVTFFRPSAQLADRPLWPDGVASPLAPNSWHDLVSVLPEGENWDVWTDWYEALIKGAPLCEEIELIYAAAPEEKWNESPAAANAWIRAERDAAQRGIAGEDFECE